VLVGGWVWGVPEFVWKLVGFYIPRGIGSVPLLVWFLDQRVRPSEQLQRQRQQYCHAGKGKVFGECEANLVKVLRTSRIDVRRSSRQEIRVRKLTLHLFRRGVLSCSELW